MVFGYILCINLSVCIHIFYFRLHTKCALHTYSMYTKQTWNVLKISIFDTTLILHLQNHTLAHSEKVVIIHPTLNQSYYIEKLLHNKMGAVKISSLFRVLRVRGFLDMAGWCMYIYLYDMYILWVYTTSPESPRYIARKIILINTIYVSLSTCPSCRSFFAATLTTLRVNMN